MTETPEPAIKPTGETERNRDETRHEGPSRLVKASAWTGIVAGVVLSLAVIFFSGFFVGWSSGSQYGWQRGHEAGMDHGGSMMTKMMAPGATMEPGAPKCCKDMPASPEPSTSLPDPHHR